MNHKAIWSLSRSTGRIFSGTSITTCRVVICNPLHNHYILGHYPYNRALLSMSASVLGDSSCFYATGWPGNSSQATFCGLREAICILGIQSFFMISLNSAYWLCTSPCGRGGYNEKSYRPEAYAICQIFQNRGGLTTGNTAPCSSYSAENIF